MSPVAITTAKHFPSLPVPRLGWSQPVFVRFSRKNVTITCSSTVTDGGEHSLLERCFNVASAEYGPVMKGDYGAFGAVTLEKGKLDMTQQQKESTPELATGGGYWKENQPWRR